MLFPSNFCKLPSGKDTMLLPIQGPLLNQVLSSLGGPAQNRKIGPFSGVYFKEIVSKSSSRQVKLWVSLIGWRVFVTPGFSCMLPFSLSIDQLPMVSHSFLLSCNGLRMAWVALILGFTGNTSYLVALYVSSHSTLCHIHIL